MSKKEFPDYTIGIDLGTNSVGWAAINDDYKLLRLCGKDAWGALLADSAESAESRRLMRCARRRYARRRERIKLLRELFAPLIAPIDENFFIRLDESSLRVGDGEFFRKNHYNIFDGDYTDRDYFRGENTRTVYHLRKMLAETDEKADIRLVYLAVHHMVKYRGHFLLEGRAFAKEGSMLSEAMSDPLICWVTLTGGRSHMVPSRMNFLPSCKTRAFRVRLGVTGRRRCLRRTASKNMQKSSRAPCSATKFRSRTSSPPLPTERRGISRP